MQHGVAILGLCVSGLDTHIISILVIKIEDVRKLVNHVITSQLTSLVYLTMLLQTNRRTYGRILLTMAIPSLNYTRASRGVKAVH